MHDYFDILGVSRNARGQEIRRASLRRVRQVHPDIGDDPSVEAGSAFRYLTRAGSAAAVRRDLPDVAIDFLDITPLVDRMRDAFFSRER